jgi:hypothetical protein
MQEMVSSLVLQRKAGKSMSGHNLHGLLNKRLLHWCTGKLVHWRTGTLVHWRTGALAHWSTGRLATCKTGRLAEWQTGRLTAFPLKVPLPHLNCNQSSLTVKGEQKILFNFQHEWAQKARVFVPDKPFQHCVM